MNMEKPKNPQFSDFVNAYVAAQGFLHTIQTSLELIEVGKVVLKVPFSNALSQHTGAFHGGVIGALSEAVMGACAATVIRHDQTVVGAEYKVNFLSPAVGEALIAEGEVIKAGRSLTVCRATLQCLQADGSLKVVAIAQGTMANISTEPNKPKS
ncbi:MAG: PaaI family thioesterase [Burkholderiaceae bacterium]